VGEWSASLLSRSLPPGKTRYPLYRRLGGPQGRSGRVENLVPTGIRSRTVKPTELPGPRTNWYQRQFIYSLYAVRYAYMYTYISTFRDAVRAKEIKIFGKAVNARCQGNLYTCHFGHANHTFNSPGLKKKFTV